MGLITSFVSNLQKHFAPELRKLYFEIGVQILKNIARSTLHDSLTTCKDKHIIL